MVDVATHRVAGEHQYDGMTMPMAFPKEHLDKVKELEYREDDILVATCAKAGKRIFFLQRSDFQQGDTCGMPHSLFGLSMSAS